MAKIKEIRFASETPSESSTADTPVRAVRPIIFSRKQDECEECSRNKHRQRINSERFDPAPGIHEQYHPPQYQNFPMQAQHPMHQQLPVPHAAMYPNHPIHPTAFLPPAPRPHPFTPARRLHNMGFGPSPLFGWESVTPLAYQYGQPAYIRRVKPDYRRFCFSVGKADVPYAALPGGPLWGYPTAMAPQLVGRW